MKHFLFIYVLIVLWSGFAGAQSFDEALKFSQQGEKDKAQIAFLSLCDQGDASACYNLGYLHYEQAQVAEAIYYFKKALILHPGLAPASNNLAVAEKAAGIEQWELPGWQFGRFADRLLSRIPQWILMVFYLSFALSGLWLWFRSMALVRRAAGQVLTALSLIVAVALYQQYVSHNTPKAIVMTADTGLYISPDEASEKKYGFRAGEEVLILDRIGQWLKVRTQGYETGWSDEKNLRRLQ
ncbi:MAG TPA: tetratricopeptide repeat protein [Saprospiraceae bacterium]|nr:tetratricopeptide repeat protein [Saprospiraceae bacterium]